MERCNTLGVPFAIKMEALKKGTAIVISPALTRSDIVSTTQMTNSATSTSMLALALSAL